MTENVDIRDWPKAISINLLSVAYCLRMLGLVPRNTESLIAFKVSLLVPSTTSGIAMMALDAHHIVTQRPPHERHEVFDILAQVKR